MLLPCICFTGCTNENHDKETKIIDMAGDEIILPEKIERVVSLLEVEDSSSEEYFINPGN